MTMDVVFNDIGSFIMWLGNHQNEAYLILFLGAYFETLIGFSFFIPGELFLIAGSVLAGTNVLSILYVTIVLYLGAVLGDNSSYFIGRYTGSSIFKKGRRVFSVKNYNKGTAFFEKHGSKAIFFARLTGPLSWITPFLAGVYKVPYKTFFLYNTPGIIIGVGEFIVAGYFFGYQYQLMIDIISKYFAIVIALAAVLFVVYWMWRKSVKNN